MAWFLSFTFLFIAYGAYKAIELTSPKHKIQRLEAKSHELYVQVKRQLEKDLAAQMQHHKNDGKPLLPTEANQSSINDLKEYLQHIKAVEEKFVQLKEQYKRLPAKKQMEIYTDWYEYTLTLSSTESEQRGVRDLLSPADYLNTLKSLTAKRETIERTFDRKLKA